MWSYGVEEPVDLKSVIEALQKEFILRRDAVIMEMQNCSLYTEEHLRLQRDIYFEAYMKSSEFAEGLCEIEELIMFMNRHEILRDFIEEILNFMLYYKVKKIMDKLKCRNETLDTMLMVLGKLNDVNNVEDEMNYEIHVSEMINNFTILYQTSLIDLSTYYHGIQVCNDYLCNNLSVDELCSTLSDQIIMLQETV